MKKKKLSQLVTKSIQDTLSIIFASFLVGGNFILIYFISLIHYEVESLSASKFMLLLFVICCFNIYVSISIFNNTTERIHDEKNE